MAPGRIIAVPMRWVGGSVEQSRGPSRTRGMLTAIRRQMSSAAAAVAGDLTMDSASDALAHHSTTDYTLNATVVTKPIGRLIRTNGDMSLIFYALFACSALTGRFIGLQQITTDNSSSRRQAVYIQI